jgi:hypothetical protein
MILHQDFTLIILTSLATYFSMHQGSHLAYLSVDRAQLNPVLTILMNIEQYAGPIFLIWYGFKTVWYYPFLLIAVCFPPIIVLAAIEQTLKLTRNAWVISVSGILFVPVLLYFMVAHVNTAGS